jgi:hypothetical protein
MAASRNYSTGVFAALIAVCNGTCYAPGCPEPVVKFIDGRPMVNLEIAHIRALNDGGPRYKEGLSPAALNAYVNLLLLCRGHHTLIDKSDPDAYSVETLNKWKLAREGKAGFQQLGRLVNVTEDRLQELVSDAMGQFTEQLGAALDRLEQIDANSAQLLRVLTEQLSSARWHRPVVDPDAAANLSRAAMQLGHLPDTVTHLGRVVDRLSKLKGMF